MTFLANWRASIAARCRTTTSDQLTAPRLRWILWGSILLLWGPLILLLAVIPVAVRAQSVEAGFQVPVLLFGVSMFLSTLSGLTALLVRVERELSAAPDRPLLRPVLLVSVHMSGSWLAGILAFILNQANSWPAWPGLAFVVALSFVGAKGVEWYVEKVMPGITRPGGAAGGAP